MNNLGFQFTLREEDGWVNIGFRTYIKMIGDKLYTCRALDGKWSDDGEMLHDVSMVSRSDTRTFVVPRSELTEFMNLMALHMHVNERPVEIHEYEVGGKECQECGVVLTYSEKSHDLMLCYHCMLHVVNLGS